MTKVAVNGCLGRMGSLIAEKVVEADDLELGAGFEMPGVDEVGRDLGREIGAGELGVEVTGSDGMEEVLLGADVLIDFTAPPATESALKNCVNAGTAIVIGTTGLDEDQMELVEEASREIPVMKSPNYAKGVNVLWDLVRRAASLLDYDAEVIEAHHRHKRDAPSGTALRIADEVEEARGGGKRVHGREGMVGEREDDELGMHAVRAGDIAGDHTLLLAGDGERLELTHRAHSREPFVYGALEAARFVDGVEPGRYGMDDVLEL